ncbi:MAG TPA: hypothetical protein VM121_11090 [Acidimicrobiales bacterium]|nr:hypothetical protein [Acidimicrobiales bacterium]
MVNGLRSSVGAVVALVVAVACTPAGGGEAAIVEAQSSSTTLTTATVTTTSTLGVTTTAAPVATVPDNVATEAAAATTPAPATNRVVTEQAWTPFAEAGGVTLLNPATRIERVGFHEANHDGARQLQPLSTAVAPITLPTRDRATDSRTAADVVVDPASEIRSPVTGTVLEAGTYTLYCRYSDDYLIIEPDQHPGWEVKVLHIDGVAVGPGDRVVAAQTMIAPGPTKLPFMSDVDEFKTADPAWPHVHMEIIDPSIPDIPSPSDNC